ncbi:DUF4355 domain-containing protein [Fictibacillus sp. 18YEL24]|uniref:DUF4355 domain-containing protein n=1 Tax=Fictibacillus sp. 18YEL24 TaxID=2745875 RepID=UPI0018CD01D5|nr:DUF4355 domain-containing protein [Fictibacillus sp. 18YEL24]MBH0171031.1 DUF4355 domain-containing protein [Fictibacillus sp. 18YEL24]
MPTLEEVRAFLEQNQGDQAVQEFVRGLNPVTVDRIKDLANSDNDTKAWLQAQKDSFFSTSLETWKKNNLDDLVMGKVKELYPDETEEQKRIKILEQKLEAAEKEKSLESLRNKAISLATEKGLPASLVDFFLGEDEEKTTENLAKLEETFNPYIESKVNERFKETGRNFTKGSDGKDTVGSSYAKSLNDQQKTQEKTLWD